MLSVRFWGVRGSIPSPGEHTTKYGGNTSCLEIRAGDHIIIVDFGSGARALGINLIKSGALSTASRIDVFVTHTHLDHLIGFPHFSPIFVKDTKLHIHCPKLPNGKKLEDVLKTLLSYEFWPVSFDELPANLSFTQHGQCTMDLGDGLTVTTKFLNHPVCTLGYRFEYHGKSIATSYDNEPFWNIFGSYKRSPDNPPHSFCDNFYCEDSVLAGDCAAHEGNKKLLDFYRNADILIYDCQYTKNEYINGRLNWGHSMIERAEEIAVESGVKNLLIYHHDPSRGDDELSKFEEEYKSKVCGAKIIIAKEGLVINA
jgi:phosphoribosyl 1,2-cyclic phosphodiesterase